MAEGLTVSVRSDVSEVQRYLSDVQKRVVPQVVASSLTTIARDEKRGAAKEIRAEIAIPARQINKRIRVGRAKPKRWIASVIINLRYIIVSKMGKPRQLKKGAKAGKYFIPHGFVRDNPRKPGDGPIIFVRKTADRWPLAVPKIQMDPLATNIMDARWRRTGPRFRRIFIARLTKALKKRGLYSGKFRAHRSALTRRRGDNGDTGTDGGGHGKPGIEFGEGTGG